MVVLYQLCANLLMWISVVAPLAAADTELYVASKKGDLDVVRQLTGKTCDDVDEPADDLRWTPLHAAARFGHFQIALLLVSCNAEPNVRTSAPKDLAQDDWTPLMLASRHGHIKIVKLLLSMDTDVNIKMGAGWNALMMAARYNHVDSLNALISKKANLDDIRDDGWTALMMASGNSWTDVLSALLDAGADANIKIPTGETAKELATGKHALIITSILELYEKKKICR